MAKITVRALDGNGDPLNGNGTASFVSDLAAVRQIISTRLLFLRGEWFESLGTGTPLFQSILGAGSGRHPQAVSLILTQRILGTPYVTGMSNLQTAYDPDKRAFSFACLVQTQFGTLTVSTIPGSSATITR